MEKSSRNVPRRRKTPAWQAFSAFAPINFRRCGSEIAAPTTAATLRRMCIGRCWRKMRDANLTRINWKRSTNWIWRCGAKRIPGMVKWLAQLHSSGMKLGLLSNMHPGMVTHCRKQFAWLKNFDFVTFSGEVRLIKPDPAIYEHTLRGLGVTASEALFLDDREVNIRAAHALGIHALRFESIEQLRRELESAGFTILPVS